MSPEQDALDDAAEKTEETDDVSRRVFVQHLTFFGGGVVLLGGCKEDKPVEKPAAAAPPTTSHKTFTNEEWATLPQETLNRINYLIGTIGNRRAKFDDRLLKHAFQSGLCLFGGRSRFQPPHQPQPPCHGSRSLSRMY